MLCLSLAYCWPVVRPLEFLAFVGCRAQIGRDKREGALHVIHHVAATRVDVADQHAPTGGLVGVDGFLPEAEDENLIQQRSL